MNKKDYQVNVITGLKGLLVLMAMLLMPIGAWADSSDRVKVSYLLDEQPSSEGNAGKVVATISQDETTQKETVTLTVTPKDGNYIEATDITVTKTIPGNFAQTRGSDVPAIDTPVSITAVGTPDITGKSVYTFDVTDESFVYYVTANFHKRITIEKEYNAVLANGPFKYSGEKIEPKATLTVKETTLTENTDFKVTYDNNINAGEGTVTLEGLGKYTGSLTGKGNNGLSALTFVIDRVDLTVTAENKTATYGKDAPEYTVTYEGFVNNETASVLGGQLAFACDYKKGSAAGIYAITPSGLTSDNYEITFAKGTLTVDKVDLTVTAPKVVDGLVYTGAAQALITAGSSDGGEMQYSLDGKTYDKAIPTGTDAKTYTVYYTVAADGNHNAVEAKTVSATIAKAKLTVKANDMTITQGAEAPEYTVTYDGFVNDESASVLGGELAFNCEYRQGADAGTYTIMPEGLTSSNYDIVYDKGKLTVEKREEPAKENNTGIAFTSFDAKAVIGESVALPKLQNPYNLPIEWLSSNIKVATVDQNGMVTLVGPGVAEIWAVFKGNNLFESVSAMYLLTVIQKMGTGIAFPVEEIEAVLGETFQAPGLQNPYGLTVEYLSKNPDVATIDQNGVVTLTGAGVAEIWAIFKGNDNYIAAAAMYLLNVLERTDPLPEPPAAINDVTITDDSNDKWYSLSGQRISKPTKKGIYILNGKKIAIK